MRTPALRVFPAPVLLIISALTLACSGGGDAATKAADPVIAETPEAYREYAARLRREGKHNEAANAALKAYTLARTGPRVAERLELAKAFGAGGKSASAINEIKLLEKERSEQNLSVDAVSIAEVYAQIGDPNAVFRWLPRAVEAKSLNLAGIENNPDFEPVKSDPRWAQFLATIPK
ncbi:MAG: hypothetical protein ACREMA_05760 [Longimicrobiales bacterium]